MSESSENGRSRSRGVMIGGLSTLLVGVAFWVRSPVPLTLNADRWWAVLMLLPVAMFLFPRAGSTSSRGKRVAAGGILGIAAVFLFTPGMGAGWPLLLVIVGITAIVA